MQDWPGDLPAPTLPGEKDRLCQTQIWCSQEGCLGLAAFDSKPQSSQGLFALQVALPKENVTLPSLQVSSDAFLTPPMTHTHGDKSCLHICSNVHTQDPSRAQCACSHIHSSSCLFILNVGYRCLGMAGNAWISKHQFGHTSLQSFYILSGTFRSYVPCLKELYCGGCLHQQCHLWRSCWSESWLVDSTYVVSFGDGNSESILLGPPGSNSHSLLLSSLFVLFYFLKQIWLYRQPEPVSLQRLSMFLFRISPKWIHLHF